MLYLKQKVENYNIEQVNIGLGKGKALETFNENIINFEIIK